MTVVVLETKPHRSVVKEVVCRNCGSLLQYTPRDVKSRLDYDYGGGCDEIKFIECPVCGYEPTV